MSRKPDIRQIDAIGKEFDMDEKERRKFGDYIETIKDRGHRGSARGGDFTYRELREKAREFRGEKP